MTSRLNINLSAVNSTNSISVANQSLEKSVHFRVSKAEFERFLLQCFLSKGNFPVIAIQIHSSRIVCVPDPQNLKSTASNFLSLTHAVACSSEFRAGVVPSVIAEKMAKQMNSIEKAKCLSTLAIINGELGLNMRSFSYQFFYSNSFEYPQHSSVQEILQEAKKISNLLLTHPALRKFVPYLNDLPTSMCAPTLNAWLESIEKRLSELLNGHTVLFSKYQFFYEETTRRTLATWDNIPLNHRPYALKYSAVFDAIPSSEIVDKSCLPEFLSKVPCVILNLETQNKIPLFTGGGYVPYSPVCSVIYNPQHHLEKELVDLTKLPTVISQTAAVAELERLFLIGRVHPLVGLNSGFSSPPPQEKQIMDLETFSNLLQRKQNSLDQPDSEGISDFERVYDQAQLPPDPENRGWADSFKSITHTSSLNILSRN